MKRTGFTCGAQKNKSLIIAARQTFKETTNSHWENEMKRDRLKILIAAVALMLVGIPLWAHHGNASYDDKNPITIKGTVTEFAWTNPHVQIYLDVKDDKGGVVHWSVETYSPGKLVRAGWTKESVKPGDPVSINLIPAKSGAPVGFLHKLVLPDGTVLGLQELEN
jgi:Family of unknown function (DUF6152)